MQLKTALANKGYKVKDLFEKLSNKYAIDYPTTARYCRCITRKCLNPVVWNFIDECLVEMEVEWNG